jgi:hypothetical protein
VVRLVEGRATGERVVRRLRQLKAAAAHGRWREYTRQVVGSRRILARVLKGQLFRRFEAWVEFWSEATAEKNQVAARIQAQRRGQLQRRARRHQKLAAEKIQKLQRGRQGRSAAAGLAARECACLSSAQPPSYR